MRPTRLIYVENDPALRGVMGNMLAAHPDLDVVLIASGAEEVFASDTVDTADVALIDLALGAGKMNGIDLGIALRERRSDMGIVIHSQHSASDVARRLPATDSMGWSFLPKTGDMRINDLAALLRSTARGMSTGTPPSPTVTDRSVLEQLNDRQRAVMALASDGLSAPEIARRLGGSHESVRQDLSRAYRVLVPNVSEGEDRRTKAVLTYLRLVRDDSWEQA